MHDDNAAVLILKVQKISLLNDSLEPLCSVTMKYILWLIASSFLVLRFQAACVKICQPIWF